MRAKRWVTGSVAAAVVATSMFVAPVAGRADAVPDGPPRVIEVDRSGAQPVVHIDWGTHIDAPVGVLEFVDGRKIGVPNEMTSVIDDLPSVAPRSYRADACYDRCDPESIADGTATLVVGEWLRPEGEGNLDAPGPRVAPSWGGNRMELSFSIDDAPGAPAYIVFRNGSPIVVGAWPAYRDSDGGPFAESMTYSVTACYADCTVSAAISGFARESAPGPAYTVRAAQPPIPTWTSARCSPTIVNGPLEIDLETVCTLMVFNAVFALEEPTGTATFTSDNNDLLPPSSCTLHGAECDVVIAPAPGSAGPHAIDLAYNGDAGHDVSEIRRAWLVERRPTATVLACDAASVVVPATLGCTVTVTDEDPRGRSVPSGTVTVTGSPETGIAPATCTLDGGTCRVTLSFQPGSAGAKSLVADYSEDQVHASSASAPVPIVVERRPTNAVVFCAGDVVNISEQTTCFFHVYDVGNPALPLTGAVTFTFQPIVASPTVLTCAVAYSGCTVVFTPPSGSAGTVAVLADYPGDSAHLPLRLSTSILVKRIPTRLAASPPSTSLKLSARLTNQLTGHGVEGKRVHFEARGSAICAAVTDATGTASCSGPIVGAASAAGYTAIYDGDATYRPATATADGVQRTAS